MAKQVLLYDQAVPLSNEKHRDWSIKVGSDYSFAADINAVPLTAVEIIAAAAEYPIIFASKEGSMLPLAMLGIRKEQSLYVDEDGTWNAKYIPAFIRRYPFVFSSATEDGKSLLCIDESFSGCNTEGRGERLFDSDGVRSQYLERVLGFLRNYQLHFERTRLFCQKLIELDVMEPILAQMEGSDGAKQQMSGFMAVNRKKLKAVPADKIAELLSTDELELIYLHMFSLRNFQTMFEKAGERAKIKDSETSSFSAEGDADTAENSFAANGEEPSSAKPH